MSDQSVDRVRKQQIVCIDRKDIASGSRLDPAIAPAKIIVKGTRLLAEDLAKLVEEGLSDDDLRRQHPELTADDLDALHHYVHNHPSGHGNVEHYAKWPIDRLLQFV